MGTVLSFVSVRGRAAFDAFRTGATYTDTLESKTWPPPKDVPDEALVAAGVALFAPRETLAGAGERDDLDRYSPWLSLGAWGRAGATTGRIS